MFLLDVAFCWSAVVYKDPTFAQYCREHGQPDPQPEPAPLAIRFDTQSAKTPREGEEEVFDFVRGVDEQPYQPETPTRRYIEPDDVAEPWEDDEDFKKEYPKKYFLRHDIQNANHLAGNPHVLALPPPKWCLDKGSRIIIGGREMYFHGYKRSGRWEMGEISSLEVRDFPEGVRYEKRCYYLNRIRAHKTGTNGYNDVEFGVMSEDKGLRSSAKYHRFRKSLYKIGIVTKDVKCKKGSYPGKTMHRHTYAVLDMSYNPYSAMVGVEIHPVMCAKFINRVQQIVKEDVPDILCYPVTPDDLLSSNNRSESMDSRLFPIIFQHKLGKSLLGWTNLDKSALHLYKMMGEFNRGEEFSGGFESGLKRVRNDKSRRQRKFWRIFRKYPNWTGLLQASFQECYRKSVPAMVNAILTSREGFGGVVDPSRSLNFLMKFLKSSPDQRMYNLVAATKGNSDTFVHNLGMVEALHNYHFKEVPVVTEAWLSLCERFARSGEKFPSWVTFRDMHNMSEQYHLRIRPNRFNNAEDVKQLHDTLVGFINRDDRTIENARREGKKFKEYDHPDKEYDGFRFEFMSDPVALVEEGRAMRHCVGNGSYADKCLEGRSLIFSMRKGDRRYVTLELSGRTKELKILQHYSIGDVIVSGSAANKIIQTWLRDLNNMHVKDVHSYQELVEMDIYQAQLEDLEGQLLSERDPVLLEIITHRVKKLRDALASKPEVLEPEYQPVINGDDLPY